MRFTAFVLFDPSTYSWVKFSMQHCSCLIVPRTCSVPEVISLPITGGNSKYLEWIKNSTRENWSVLQLWVCNADQNAQGYEVMAQVFQWLARGCFFRWPCLSQLHYCTTLILTIFSVPNDLVWCLVWVLGTQMHVLLCLQIDACKSNQMIFKHVYCCSWSIFGPMFLLMCA